MVSGYDVDLIDEERMDEFIVKFKGPEDSPYFGVSFDFLLTSFRENGELESPYRISIPSSRLRSDLLTKFFIQTSMKRKLTKNANTCFRSGSVCLDVINQTWSPMYDLVNIFEIFLPQLLLYPNPSDPLNAEAASLQIKSADQYNEKVKSYVNKFAKAANLAKPDN